MSTDVEARPEMVELTGYLTSQSTKSALAMAHTGGIIDVCDDKK